MLQVAGIEIIEEGQGAETIVMLHGWPDTHHLWDKQVDALKPHFKCVRFTLPGFVDSLDARAHSLDEITALIEEVVRKVSPGKPVILLAHDWGAIFSYHFVQAHPDLVSKVIGVDIGDIASPDYVASLSAKQKMGIAGYQLWLAAAWLMGPGIGDDMARFMARKLRAPAGHDDIGHWQCYPYFIRWSGAHGSFKALRPFMPDVPMLYIYGRRKPFMFHSEQWLRQLNEMPDCKTLGLEAGHWMMDTVPDAFNEVMLQWLGVAVQPVSSVAPVSSQAPVPAAAPQASLPVQNPASIDAADSTSRESQTDSDAPEIPAALAQALEASPAAKKVWDELPARKKQTLSRPVAQAKMPATIEKRVQNVIATLTE
ncbi:MAG: alpha/beta fold hydrolase [Burkholderiaceae bacterium]